MKKQFVCEEWKPGCDYKAEGEDDEVIRRDAEEHLRTQHPEEALEADRANALIIGMMKPA
jgi:predicted small metal-binding protein